MGSGIYFIRQRHNSSRDEYVPTPFCTILPSTIEYLDSMAAEGLIGDRSYYWKEGTTIRIFFFDGTGEIQNKVLTIAKSWTPYTKVDFEQVYDKYGESDIRISFNCKGYNSLLGKQSLEEKFKFKRTMCLQGLDTMKNNEVFERTVLHEFGHVMGFLHELQNPSVRIPWDTSKLFKYYDSAYGWKPDSVKKWVLDLYDLQSVDASEFDSLSIMVYAVPKEVTKNGYYIKWPKKLSKKDKEKATEFYQIKQ